jgi:tetratricopeptide (TPR) repeat protein
MRRVWMTVGCVLISSLVAAQGPTAKRNPETDALVVQMSSELRRAVQQSDIGTTATDPQKRAGLSYDAHMSDCENRWVALYHKDDDSSYTYGFVYIDSEAGFTLHYVGRFTIDSDGNYHVAPNPISPDKMTLIIRLEQNGIAALLPARGLSQLDLPEKPDWLKSYEDRADPITHKVNWGSIYNGIGDSRRALDFLEAAYREKPDAPKVVFELAYAYNALQRPEDAIRVSKDEFRKNPKDELLCRELAFAYLHLNSYKDAVDQYKSCIALCDDSDSGRAEKSELAMNLSAAFGQLGDAQNRGRWLEQAKAWAPKGSPVYRYFHPDEE